MEETIGQVCPVIVIKNFFLTYIGYDFGEEITLRCIRICQSTSFEQKVTKPVIKIWDSDKSDWVEVGFVQLK
jgi:hypothetical protein